MNTKKLVLWAVALAAVAGIAAYVARQMRNSSRNKKRA